MIRGERIHYFFFHLTNIRQGKKKRYREIIEFYKTTKEKLFTDFFKFLFYFFIYLFSFSVHSQRQNYFFSRLDENARSVFLPNIGSRINLLFRLFFLFSFLFYAWHITIIIPIYIPYIYYTYRVSHY